MRILIGLLLILFVSPLTVWYAESQHRAKDLASALQVEATSQISGYIVVDGATSSAAPLICPRAIGDEQLKECVYIKTTLEQYIRDEQVQCGDISQDKRIITQVDDRCDDDGCEPCYRIEVFRWDTLSTSEEFSQFSIGSYKIIPDASADFVGTDKIINYLGIEIDGVMSDRSNPEVGDQETSYEVLKLENQMLAAGDAVRGSINGAEKIFVISSMSYDATLTELQSQDKGTALGLRVFSFILMVLGFALFATGITGIFTGIGRIVPILGKAVHKGVTSAVAVVAGLTGAAVWFVVWGVVLVVKNIWVILGILVIAGIIIAIILVKKKKGAKQVMKKPEAK